MQRMRIAGSTVAIESQADVARAVHHQERKTGHEAARLERRRLETELGMQRGVDQSIDLISVNL